MATLTFPAVTPTTISSQAVSMRTNWGSPWVSQPDLHATRFSFGTGEAMSAAEFHYRFGQVIVPGGSTWVTKPVVGIDPRSWVRITATGTGGRTGFEWVGLWRRAEKHDVRQRFSAIGLEWLLAIPCKDSPWWDGTNVLWIGRGLEFNADGRPNRSADKKTVNGKSVYVFDPTGTDYWTTQDAVESILAWAATRSATGTVLFNWTPVGLANLPGFDAVRLPTHGRTFLDLLRGLITRHHLVTWKVYTSTSGATTTVYFSVHSFTETAIDLFDQAGDVVGTIPANTGKDSIVCTYDQSAHAVMVTEATHVADQVVVTGNRRQVVFSLSFVDGSLGKLWTDDQQTKYLAGASTAPDYPPAEEIAKREERDRDARAAEKLAPVFAWFGPAADWDQTASGDADNEDLHAIATEDVDDFDSTQFKLYAPLLKLEEDLPLRTNYDHTGTKISDLEEEPGYHAEDLSPEGTTLPHERLPLLVWVRGFFADGDPDAQDRWQRVDRLARAADLEQLDNATRRWSSHPKPLSSQLGFEIRVQNEQQHVLAADETDGLPLAVAGAIYWSVDLLATVCLEDTRPVEVRYPADGDLSPLGEVPNVIRIEATGRELIRVLPNTVVGVDPETGELQRTDGGTLVDDRPEMFLLAQRCYQWHRVPRYALQFHTGWLDGAVQVGRLITQITDSSGTWPVLSIVTELTIEFPVSEGPAAQPPRMSVVTAFMELDPLV